MSKFITLPVFDKGQSIHAMSYVNIDQIRYIIPQPNNKCKIVFDQEFFIIINENYEDIREMLIKMGYFYE